MSSAREAREIIHRYDTRVVAPLRVEMNTFLGQIMIHVFEQMWMAGVMELPPLGWCRTEPWYVGDLR